MEATSHNDRSHWKLEKMTSFEETKTKTRAYWHSATSEERFQAAAKIKETVYGKSAATAKVARVLKFLHGS